MKVKKILIALLVVIMVMSMVMFVACDQTPEVPDQGNNQPSGGENNNKPSNPDTPKFTVKFMVDGEVYHEVEVERNATVAAPEDDPVKEGYTFVGWKGYSASQKIKSDKTFSAEFQKEMNGIPTAEDFQTPDTVSVGSDYQVNVYEASKTSEAIDIDGVLDDAYLDATPIEIAARADGSDSAKGFAYIVWDSEYLYVFVVVNDSDVALYGTGDRWLSDSVELVLDTYNKASGKTQNYGDGYRGGDYCGEGQFRINAGDASVASGLHWMWDNGDIEKKGASRVIEGEGYTAEFKIAWGSFQSKAKSGEQVAIALLINNGASGNRSGVVGLEAGQIDAFQWAGVLSKLNLVD